MFILFLTYNYIVLGNCGKNAPLLLEALLENGAAATAAEREKSGKTAADLALAQGNTDLADRLRSLEKSAAVTEKFDRCELCNAKMKSRTKLHFLRDQVRNKKEENPLVLELFEDETVVEELIRPVYHRVSNCMHLRKEVTESMALIHAVKRLKHLRNAEDGSWRECHIVDLCCGSSITSALALQILPGCAVTACDISAPSRIPHYKEAGVSDRIDYLQHDICAQSFMDALRQRIKPGRRIVVLGMHCCGELSIRAIEIFTQMKAEVIFLMPCCLPSKASLIAPEIYAVKDQAAQYLVWGQHLSDRAKAVSDSTDLSVVDAVLSARNVLITARGRPVPVRGRSPVPAAARGQSAPAPPLPPGVF